MFIPKVGKQHDVITGVNAFGVLMLQPRPQSLLGVQNGSTKKTRHLESGDGPGDEVAHASF